MLLFALVMALTWGFLLALVTWGRSLSMRARTLITAVVLNTFGLAVPWMGAYTAIFLILMWCAFIAAVVAAVSPRWSWIAGTAASPWFLAPHLAWNAVSWRVGHMRWHRRRSGCDDPVASTAASKGRGRQIRF